MTDLHMSLWIAGCALILGVLFYNFWQEYKAKKNVERAFGQQQGDVLMQSGGSRPVSLRESDLTQQVSSTTIGRQEPSLDPSPIDVENNPDVNAVKTEVPEGMTPQPTPNKLIEAESLPVDEFIDCVIAMELEFPTRGEKIMSEIQSCRRVGNKPVHFVATNTDGQREVILPKNSYTHLLAGVQLVTRSCSINELEYSELVMKLRQIGDNLNAHSDIPDMKHVIDAGRDLHLFVAEHDAQLSVNIHTNGAPWGISTLLAALERHGFDMRPDGRLAMLDGEGGTLFTLSTNCGVSDQTTKRITLLLDVPCVTPSRGGFNAIISCAKLLATRLGGTVVDDSNAILTDATLKEIQDQVDSFYNSMAAAEIPAGSTRALRIFS